MSRILLISLCLILSTAPGCDVIDVRSGVAVHRGDKEISLSELLLLHNRERGKRKIEQLDLDPELARSAQAWAERMAARHNLKHSSLGGTKYNSMGENIAMGQSSEESVLEAWMNSSGHRRNILNRKFTHAGFGCAKTADGTLFWCAQFGGE